MDILFNPQLKCVQFKISGRSDGGTNKTGQIMQAIMEYKRHVNTPGYASISVQLEDGTIHAAEAKRIIAGYLRAAGTLQLLTRMSGGKLDIDLGFVRL